MLGGESRREALARHGVGSAAGGAVFRVVRTIHRLTREHDVEVAGMVDADSGDEPLPVVLGTRRAVDASSHLRAMASGRQYVVLHSHPDSESFGSRDAGWLTDLPAVRALIVVGRNGTWYLLSRDPAGAGMTAAEVTLMVRAEYDRLCPPGDIARIRGATGRVGRVRELSHEIWTGLAGQLGFRYDRVR